MKDLTKGPIVPQIIIFAAPVLFGSFLQLLYNLADTRIVGTFLGEQALAAVGATNSVNNLLLGLIVGMSNGFAILTARRFGAGDMTAVRKSVGSIFLLAAIITVFLTAGGMIFVQPILSALNTPEHLLPVSVEYFRVILMGIVATMYYNVCATVLRAVGDAITPLIFLMISVLLNIILDIVFVVPLNMGVQGAALATVCAQFISVLLCIFVMHKRFNDIFPKKRDFTLEKDTALQLLGTGISMAMMNALVNMGSVILQGAINGFGDDIIIAHTAARRLTEMFMLSFTAFGTTMATFTSQNFGARKPERIRKGIYSTLIMAFVLCGMVVIICYLASPFLVYQVTGTYNEVVIQTASKYLKINTIFYWITAAIVILRNSLQGVGDGKTPLISSTIELVGKIAVVIWLTPKLGYLGIMISEPIVWAIMVLPLIFQVLRHSGFKGTSENV